MKQETIGKIAWLIAIAAVLVVCIFSGSCKKDSPASPNHKEVEGAPRGVTVMCIGEHEYYYSKDYSIHFSSAFLAPKFDKDGMPSRCKK